MDNNNGAKRLHKVGEGSTYAYRHLGCRCAECKFEHAAEMRTLRQRQADAIEGRTPMITGDMVSDMFHDLQFKRDAENNRANPDNQTATTNDSAATQQASDLETLQNMTLAEYAQFRQGYSYSSAGRSDIV
jgi:hypothetical protein